MKLIRQPNSWSCTLAAAAMVFDSTIEELIKYIGHDGSEIIVPSLKPPGCYKGFHIQEIVDVALLFNYALVPIEILPVQTPTGQHEFAIEKWGLFSSNQSRFDFYFTGERGLLIGKAREYWHTVAFEEGMIYDPNGTIYNIDDCKLQIQTLWITTKL